jgi:hypothetical protein
MALTKIGLIVKNRAENRKWPAGFSSVGNVTINTLWTGEADLRLHITTVQDGCRKSAFLTSTWFPRTIHLITQDMEHFYEWSY